MVTACGHAFCYFCLKQWLDQAHHCPTCREEIENDPHPCSLITNLVEAALARFPDTTCTERLASEKTRFKEIDEPWDLSGSSDSDSESADTWDAIQRGERIFRDVNLTSSIMSDESSHSSSSSSADEQDGDADMLAVHEYSPARSATRDSDDDASESGSSDSETSMATYPQGDAVINVTSDEDGSDDNE